MEWELIGKLSSVLTIISFILGLSVHKFKAWIEFKRINKVASKMASKRISGVLIISIGNNQIENQVKMWLKDQKDYRDIPRERIFKVERIGEVNKDNIPSIMQDIKRTKSKIQLKGVTCLHIFIAAPVVIGEMLGAELSNNFTSYLYHYNFNGKGSYQCWGKLQ